MSDIFCRYADHYFLHLRSNFLPMVSCSHEGYWRVSLPNSQPHPTPKHSSLLTRGSVSRGTWESWEEALSVPSFNLSSLSPLPAHRWAYQHALTLLWQGGQCEWDGFQIVLGGCRPKAQLPAGFISNRAPFVSCLIFSHWFQSWEGNWGMWSSGRRHTQAPRDLWLTLFL